MKDLNYIPTPVNNHAEWELKINNYTITVNTKFIYWIKRRKMVNKRVYLIAKEYYTVNGHNYAQCCEFNTMGSDNDMYLIFKRRQNINALIEMIEGVNHARI